MEQGEDLTRDDLIAMTLEPSRERGFGLGGTDIEVLESVKVVRFLSMDEVVEVQAQCVRDAGFAAETVPCVEAEGYETDQPPSQEVWIERMMNPYSGDGESWHPYSALPRSEDPDAIRVKCPQQPADYYPEFEPIS